MPLKTMYRETILLRQTVTLATAILFVLPYNNAFSKFDVWKENFHYVPVHTCICLCVCVCVCVHMSVFLLGRYWTNDFTDFLRNFL